MDAEIRDFAKTLSTIPPEPCRFKVGDVVTYTNSYGVKFHDLVIIGFRSFSEPEFLADRFIYLAKGSYWYPVKPSELTPAPAAEALFAPQHSGMAE